jgi:hypothetical protein
MKAMAAKVAVASLLLIATVAFFPGRAQASPVEDSFTYTFNSNTYTWELPASPTPTVAFSGVLFEIDNLAYSLNGVAQPAAIIDFFPSGGGGGFELSTFSDSIVLDTFGPLLYNGGEMSPTFKLGTFTLANNTMSGPTGTLVIAAVSATPEPAPLALTAAGMLMLLGLTRKKLAA